MKISNLKMILKMCVGSEALLATCLHAGLFLGLFFNPEDGGEMFL
jgi:hypothetical protein